MAASFFGMVPSDPVTIHQDLVTRGFFSVDDPITGLRIEKLISQQTPLTSYNGMRFFQLSLINHHIIRPYFMTFFQKFGLFLYRSLSPMNDVYCYRTSTAKPNRDSLIVHLVGKGTKLRIWDKSHLQPLEYHKSDKNLWHVSEALVMAFDLEPVEVSFKQGGIIIMDPRTCFSIKEGFTITLGFGTPDVVARWHPVEVPSTVEMHRIVNEMASCRVNLNVKFVPVEYP